MAVGSAFDAIVKNRLSMDVFGGIDEGEELFMQQVEPHVRDAAGPLGERVFEMYKAAGAYSDLMVELAAAEDVRLIGRLDSSVTGVGHEPVAPGTCGRTRAGTVRLLGEPDLSFVKKVDDGKRLVVFDWKVNGACSAASPAKGYAKKVQVQPHLVPGYNPGVIHKDCLLVNGYDRALTMAMCNATWGRQIAIYGWLLGSPVGAETRGAIDQISHRGKQGCKPLTGKVFVSQYRNFISIGYQRELFWHICRIAEGVACGHYFVDLTREESDKKTADLKTIADSGFSDLLR